MSPTREEGLIKKIYFTVLYLNCLHRPPTSFEVWRHFLDLSENFGGAPFPEIIEILKTLKERKKIFSEKGFWVITEKEKSSEKRIVYQKNAIKKVKKLKPWIGLMRNLPFVRGIFITGTLAMKTSAPGSDWDILVITKKDRIWLGRLIVTAFLFLVGKKRRQNKIKNRFCLNHYLTENYLLPGEKNEYTACEFGFVYPIFNQDLFNNFARLNWNWQRKFNPNFEVGRGLESGFLLKKSRLEIIKRLIEGFLETIGLANFLNRLCRKFMIKKIEKNPKTFEKGAVVIYNDGELAFWPEFKNLKRILEF